MVDLQARMVNAILEGHGLRGVAELAAVEAGGPVAIVLPARGLAAASDDQVPLDDLAAAVAERMRATNGGAPGDFAGAQPVVAGSETIGYVLALRRNGKGAPEVAVDVGEVLRAAAMVAITEVAVIDARDELADEIRGTLLDDLREDRASPEEIVRRASRLGCDLSHGAIALVTEVHSSRPQHAAALIRGEHPGAIAEVLSSAARVASGPRQKQAHPRIYAVLPVGPGTEGEERALASAKSLARRLRPHGPAAFSSVCGSPAEASRAISEAELALEVVSTDERMADQLADGMGNGVYRLLFRALAGAVCASPYGRTPPGADQGADGPRPGDRRGPRAPRARPEGIQDPRPDAAALSTAAPSQSTSRTSSVGATSSPAPPSRPRIRATYASVSGIAGTHWHDSTAPGPALYAARARETEPPNWPSRSDIRCACASIAAGASKGSSR